MRLLRYLQLTLLLTIFSVSFQVSAAESDSIESTPLKTRYTTSRFTEQDVQWTSSSITVIDQAEIEATFRRTLEDLDGYVPGMVIDTISGTPQGAAIGLRGIHSNNSSKGIEPAVAVSIDGVYVGTHAAQNQTLFDFERVEIARGPQGTFTGAPAEAGSINMVRTRPTGELGLKTRISFGDPSGNDLDAVLNFPIAEGLAGKFTVSHSDRDGDFINDVAGRRESGIDRNAYALSLLWDARDNMTVQYTIDLDKDDSDSPGLLSLSRPDDLVCVPDPANPNVTANCGNVLDLRLPESGDPQRYLQNFSNDREFEADSQILRIDAEYLDHTITSITGIRGTKEKFARDLDGTSSDRLSSNFESDYDQISTDLRISGQYSDNLTYTVGAYLFRAEYNLNRQDLFVLDTLSSAARILPPLAAGQSRDVRSSQDSKTMSVFGHVDYRWDDQWQLDAGLRFANYEKDYDHFVRGVNRVPPADLLVPATDIVLEGEKEFNEIAGNIGFRYKVDELAMVYGRYSVDHTPGGFNDNALSALSAGDYKTSTTQGLELGMKSHWLDDRLRLNMALYNNYQDNKVQRFADRVATGNIEYNLGNITDVKTRGFDLELEYAVIDDLYLRGAWGHVSAEYSSYKLPDLTAPNTTLDFQRDPERAPTNTLYLTGQYSFAYGPGTVGVFLGYQHFDDYVTNPDQIVGTVSAYGTWDATLEYTWQAYKVRLFSQNVNDKRNIRNVERYFDAEFASLLPRFTAVQGIATVADVNRPRYSGLEFIWIPDF
jgi:iron complex outermembrane receptor protein